MNACHTTVLQVYTTYVHIFFNEVKSWVEEVLSLASTPSTPERDKHPDILQENLFKSVQGFIVLLIVG